ncbi:MAG: hypothetical protein IT280_11620 [Ignavibacteria bacterium]|nr:hypothetical protein [Ignavibacteria bacterium]
MNNLKLINILRTFSKNEMKEFEKFISSPFFNRGRNYIPFFNQLKKFHPKFDDEKMTPEYIYSKIYPGKKYNKQIIWNMSSSMLAMCEDFLMYVSLGRDKFGRERQVAEEFLERRLSSYYKKKLNEMESALDSLGIGSAYFRQKAELEEGRMAYHFIEDTQKFLPELVEKKGNYIILHFMREISDIIGSMRTSKSMYNKPYEELMPYKFITNLKLDKIVEYAYKTKFKYAAVLDIYHETIMLSLEYNNKEHFFRLMELFEQNHHLFTKEEKHLVAAELTNYCVQKVNEGDASLRHANFELDKLKLKQEIVLISRILPKVTFMQILGNALYLKEYDWAVKYIEEYAPKLKPSYQKPTKMLCYAHLYYLQKEYGKVLEYLSKVEFIDTLDKIYVKTLYIRTYFEMKEFETLQSFLDTTRHFYEKNSHVSNILRSNNIKFVSCMSRLLKAMGSNDDFEMEKIRKLVKSDKTIANGIWITEKIDEIQKGAK